MNLVGEGLPLQFLRNNFIDFLCAKGSHFQFLRNNSSTIVRQGLTLSILTQQFIYYCARRAYTFTSYATIQRLLCAKGSHSILTQQSSDFCTRRAHTCNSYTTIQRLYWVTIHIPDPFYIIGGISHWSPSDVYGFLAWRSSRLPEK